MSLKSNFELMASYNQTMNRNVYKAASALNASELDMDRGAFFGSIIGTLNHILVGDTIWLKRFASHQITFSSLDYIRILEAPASLDTTVHSQFSMLAEARAKIDDVVIQFTSELTENDISNSLVYSNTKGQVSKKNFGHLLQHFFNHQTHHRGQVSTLLFQAGVDVGVTDLLVSIPNE